PGRGIAKECLMRPRREGRGQHASCCEFEGENAWDFTKCARCCGVRHCARGLESERMLFKNLDKQFVERFWTEGEIILRPLSFFRGPSDPSRSDALEGIRIRKIRPTETIRSMTDEVWLPDNVQIRSTGKRAFIQNEPGSLVDIGEAVPEGYVFSVSEM